MPEERNYEQSTDLQELVSNLVSHLTDLGYRPQTIARMHDVWRKFISYATERSESIFSMDLARAFITDHYGYLLGDRDSSHHTHRTMHVLGDFARFGTVFKSSCIKIKGFSEGYKELFEAFLKHLQDGLGFSAMSITTWRSRLFRFEHFLAVEKIMVFNDIELTHVNKYIETLMGFSSSTASGTVRQLARLFDFAYRNGAHAENFSCSLPKIRAIKPQRLPTVFTTEEVERILATIDRANPVGKRNYAIVILVAKLGLRIGDVRALPLTAIDWQKKTISIIQQKTGEPLELPLLEDVGWAIIDYLKHGRPETKCECVFVRHCAPFDKLSGALSRCISPYIRKAGIQVPIDKPRGMHSLRHSLASSMLEQNIPLHVISQTLGHRNTHSTTKYLTIAVKQLRLCPLEVNI